ncbi:MAG: 2-hydroxychromene-2-carboxylate isomerase [Pseudomonadota bacterium]
MAHIDYFFATISPFTYLAGTRLEEVAARHNATLTYKPMDIMNVFSRTGGTPPKDRHPARQAFRLEEIRRSGIKNQMPVNLKPAFWPTNPAPSSYAIIAAQKAGGGDMGALVHGFTRACWSEDLNIAEDDVVRQILEAAGFDGALADSGMLQGAEEYAANTEEAVNRNVFGAPTYIVGDQNFWGQDRIEDVDLYLSGKL